MKLHPDSQKVLDLIREAGRPPYEAMSVEEARAAYAASREATMGPPQPVTAVETIELAGPGGALPVRLYRPNVSRPLPLLVYFHGGGWVLGGIGSHDGLCRRLANGSGCAVASVEYRLAPEHPFPAAIEDATAAVRALAGEVGSLGFDASRLGVGGDSAGGTLATVAAIDARDTGGPSLACQILLYPVTDLAMDTRSHTEFAEGHLLTGASLRWFGRTYLGSRDPLHWRASPLRAERLDGLPPALVLTASHDPLRDEGEAYAQRLVTAGVMTTTWRVPGMLHGFLPMDRLISPAAPAVQTVARFLASTLGAADPATAGPTVVGQRTEVA
ncbi:alpha/beta hydrolase [Acuticoccus sp.]|uniref:alpha/beta hydrolase n=1 Tax=Acuticoccus sp. TaxID=1904378 RepID=UPI003B51CFDA